MLITKDEITILHKKQTSSVGDNNAFNIERDMLLTMKAVNGTNKHDLTFMYWRQNIALIALGRYRV